jgi:hypothetical protein
MPATVVCKPHVQFSKRLMDRTLQRLTIAQLRKEARDNGLNVSRLTEKWEFVHVLVLVHKRYSSVQEYVEYAQDSERRTIFDVPGEIRNKIYSYVLADEEPIVVTYGSCSFPRPHLHFARQRALNIAAASSSRHIASAPSILHSSAWTPTSQLLTMSWANRQLRKEIRAYYFAQNHFKIQGFKGSSYVKFLNHIGSEARTNLASIDFDGIGFWMYHSGFQTLLAACTRLRNVKIRMHIDHVLSPDTYYAMRYYAMSMKEDWEQSMFKIELLEFSSIFAGLPALQNLHLVCATPHAWVQHNLSSVSFGWSMRELQKKMLDAVEDTVLRKLKKVLKGKGSDVTVTFVGDAPTLSRDGERSVILPRS